MFRRFRVLACITFLAVLIPSPVHAQACDQACADYVRAEVKLWNDAQQVTLARVWYGAAIVSTPEAQCVLHRESRFNYRAENTVSTASGGFQFLDSTWLNVRAARGRFDLPAHAADAVWYEQAASFWWLFEREGWTPWGGGCSG